MACQRSSLYASHARLAKHYLHKDYFVMGAMGDDVIRFEPWEKVLRDTVPIKLQAAYREAVVKFLYWLRETGKAATVAAFKEHLAWKKSYLPPERYEVRHQALRWYYDQGRRLRAGAAAQRGVGIPTDPNQG